ncbi:hypothetical protein C5Y96_07865 [Blastopirellula marina]|uniref:Protein-glutamine gamma-glutamyltransferase-like C-terminal domain-containing protein n=1 Tax=Blastopirellula marina TaxID=124 RepID=A0A2S8FY05_9BACT|nr:MULTISPECIES: DUF4129 domain-containing protein [Pirellulaceae]PQO37066.1 hypothetical protein C5Y96_07865 [Blastopirellula marina]RCS53781.1 DUF4129 domain-containing protein [Bremerella cremea]
MMRSLVRQLGAVCLLLWATLLPTTNAQEWEDFESGTRSIQQPVEQGREALANIPQANWYDSESDGVRTIPVPGETRMPDTRPGTAKKKAPAAAPAARGNWNWPNLGGLSLASIVMYSILIIVLGLITYLIYRAVGSGGATTSGSYVPEQHEDEKSRQVDRVEHLPFEVKKKDGNLLDEARRCYESGNFNEAIVYLFSFQLLELDKGHIIRLAKGKTNGQYLREAGRNRDLRKILQGTMNAFEDVFFGNRNLTRDRFERCWNQLTQFNQHLAGGSA